MDRSTVLFDYSLLNELPIRATTGLHGGFAGGQVTRTFVQTDCVSDKDLASQHDSLKNFQSVPIVWTRPDQS